MRRGFRLVVAMLAVCLLASTHAFAQGGGASSTGTITGKVSDSSGAVLPGVTVNATSPSMMGVQSVVTNTDGLYRFPAVPPGTYTVTFELPGFSTLKREGIDIRLGFTAQLNVELAVASLQETVTVTGESPVIDTSTTRTQQNFKLEQLQSLPNARDMWALLAVTPGVAVNRIDVGGNRAGTQAGYTAYGFTGQVRVLIEGINTTEGTGGAGFYFDYASLEEAFLGTTGQTAEMPNPGVQSQFIAKSGGNRFAGEYHLDWYNNAMQGSNLPDEYLAPTAFKGTNGSNAIRPGSNEILGYYDHDINAGGPIRKDKVWWFGTYRAQQNKVAQPNFQFDKTFDTKLWNAVGKGTYQINQKNKVIGYYQWGQKTQPNRLPFATYTYASPEQTLQAELRKLGVQGRVERHDQRQAVSRRALRRLRLLLPAGHQQPRQLLLARHRRARLGRRAPGAAARSRPQTVDRGRHLLPRHRLGQSHAQDGRRAPQRAVVGRLHVAPRRHEQHRADLCERHLDAGDLRHSDGPKRQQLERTQRSPVARGAGRARVFRQRHMGGRPLDDQPRRAVRPLPRLAARTGAARRDGWPRHRGREQRSRKTTCTP